LSNATAPTSSVAAKRGSSLHAPAARVSRHAPLDSGTRQDAPVEDGQGRDIHGRVKGKDDEEEGPEVVKHLDEEVPREADVGGQVGHAEAGGAGQVDWSAQESQTDSRAKTRTHMTPYTLLRNAQLPVSHQLTPSRAPWCSAKARVPSAALDRSDGVCCTDRLTIVWCARRTSGGRRRSGCSERCVASERWKTADVSEPVDAARVCQRHSLTADVCLAHRREPS